MAFRLARYSSTTLPAVDYITSYFTPNIPRFSYFNEPRRFAGHSHWQNVRHTKEARDKLKSKASQFYLRAVNNAIKAGGGIRDPKLNSQLASVLAEAKANSVPMSTLDRMLKAEFTTDPYFVEMKAPGGLFILIESCAKSPVGERQKLAGLGKRYGCSVSSSSGKIANEFFDRLAWICVPSGVHPNLTSLDAATNLGIEIGANEVQEITVEGQPAYQFYCEPSYLEKMRQLLQHEHSIQPLTVEESYIPKCQVRMDSNAYKNLQEMYDKIREQHEYVDRIVDNVTTEDDDPK